jgi:hypothetical protein
VKAYFYVEARDVGNEEEGVLVSFFHVPVNAKSDKDAYHEGANLVKALRQMGRESEHFKGHFLNDYVIEVPF